MNNKEIQFSIDIDEEIGVEGDLEARQYIARKLIAIAQQVVAGGNKEECGCDHVHEYGDNWSLQID